MPFYLKLTWASMLNIVFNITAILWCKDRICKDHFIFHQPICLAQRLLRCHPQIPFTIRTLHLSYCIVKCVQEMICTHIICLFIHSCNYVQVAKYLENTEACAQSISLIIFSAVQCSHIFKYYHFNRYCPAKTQIDFDMKISN